MNKSVYEPYLDHNENLVVDCMEQLDIIKGVYINKFEDLVKNYTKANYCSTFQPMFTSCTFSTRH